MGGDRQLLYCTCKRWRSFDVANIRSLLLIIAMGGRYPGSLYERRTKRLSDHPFNMSICFVGIALTTHGNPCNLDRPGKESTRWLGQTR